MKPLPCIDSLEMSVANRDLLDIPRSKAAALGHSAVEAAENGYYLFGETKVAWKNLVETAIAAKVSISPSAPLPNPRQQKFEETLVQVTNETTLAAAARLLAKSLKPLALNFANGEHPGGGFLHGARAQEEAICRQSALYSTLVGDQMYLEHRKRPIGDSTDWMILSPDVPIFRADSGAELDEPWLLSFVTSAAPYQPHVGQPMAGHLLQKRIHRVLAVARAYQYSSLVLGAWGCGAFHNDPHRTARDFRSALEGEFRHAFQEVVFAIADWSAERKVLGPFRDMFSEESQQDVSGSTVHRP